MQSEQMLPQSDHQSGGVRFGARHFLAAPVTTAEIVGPSVLERSWFFLLVEVFPGPHIRTYEDIDEARLRHIGTRHEIELVTPDRTRTLSLS